MKPRKLLTVIFLMLFLTAGILVLLKPTPLVERRSEFYFSSLLYNGLDKTKETDEDALYDILTKYTHHRFSTGKNTYDPEQLTIEISYVTGHTPIQLLLGNGMYYFNDGKHSLYTIREGKKLLQELEALVTS